jgi:hypothetical protein
MKVFGTKQAEPTDADRAAAARLSAVAARFKPESSSDFVETESDPIGEPEASDEAQEPDAEE